MADTRARGQHATAASLMVRPAAGGWRVTLSNIREPTAPGIRMQGVGVLCVMLASNEQHGHCACALLGASTHPVHFGRANAAWACCAIRVVD